MAATITIETIETLEIIIAIEERSISKKDSKETTTTRIIRETLTDSSIEDVEAIRITIMEAILIEIKTIIKKTTTITEAVSNRIIINRTDIKDIHALDHRCPTTIMRRRETTKTITRMDRQVEK